MRALLIRNSYTYNFGGAERFPVALAKELAKYDVDCTVVSRQPRLLEYAKEEGVARLRGWWWKRQSWSGKGILLTPLYLIWQTALTCWYVRLMIQLHVDVVHPQSKDDFIGATIAGRLLGKTVVWTDHADLKYIYANHPKWYKNPVGKLVYACSKLAHRVTLVSNSEHQLIAQALGHPAPDNYVVIHNGIIDRQTSAVKRQPHEQDKVIFCATSRMVHAKGIGDLIDAFRQPTTESCVLWLVGDGPDERPFKEQARDISNITFVGHSDRPLAYVAACDVFIHPSHHEGFSLSLLEAAMLGKPIIACDVGGNAELVNERNGILVDAHAPEQLALAIRRLATDSELRNQLGAAARKDFETYFDFSKIVKERFVPLYVQK